MALARLIPNFIGSVDAPDWLSPWMSSMSFKISLAVITKNAVEAKTAMLMFIVLRITAEKIKTEDVIKATRILPAKANVLEYRV